MIKSAFKPRKYRDPRRYSFPLTFGTTIVFLDDLDLDAGLTMPDQNSYDPIFGNPALPNGCTGFTTTDIATDEDHIVYDPRFTYEKTLFMENAPEGAGCQPEDSMKSAVVYGLKAKGETDQQALTHRRGPYFQIHPDAGLDWFDSIRSAMMKNRRSVSMATMWILSWENVGSDAIISVVPSGPLRAFQDWHNWKCSGWKQIGGVPYLRAKTWQGSGYGHGGWAYFSREVINAIFVYDGTEVLTNTKAMPGDVAVVRLTIMQTLLNYLYRFIEIKDALLGLK